MVEQTVSESVGRGYYRDPTTGAYCTLPWPGDPALPYSHPDRVKLLPKSIAPMIMAWCEHYLVNPNTGLRWVFTPGQRRFLYLWWAVDDNGRFLYRRALKRGAKGTGKDPLASAMGWAELGAPVEFDRFDERGNPIGRKRARPKIQIFSNSQTQSRELLSFFNDMATPEVIQLLGVDKGQLRTMTHNGRIEVCTASERSGEGAPPTFVILNESHHMTESSGGVKVANMAKRNIGKSPKYIYARMVEFTNAYESGTDSVAEQGFIAWQDQLANPKLKQDILYDSIEADPALDYTNPDDLKIGIAQACMDAPWVDVERRIDECMDTSTPVADIIRFYFNGLATNEEAWIDPQRFDALAKPDTVVEQGEDISLFLDCSKSGDATSLTACRIKDGFVFQVGTWQPPKGAKGWLAPREEVDAVVRQTFDFYHVCWFGVDPSPAKDDTYEKLYWKDLIDGWHRDFHNRLPIWATPGELGSSVLFDMRLSLPGGKRRNQMFTEAAMATAAAIDEEGSFYHDGDPILRMHTHNARRRPNEWGLSLGKINRSSKHLVDAAVTMVGARMGRDVVLNSRKYSVSSGGRLIV